MTLRFRWEGGPEIPHRISGLIISNPDPFSEISAPAPASLSPSQSDS